MAAQKEDSPEEGQHLYDLYGVVNHTGALGGGHYTAQCFNPVEERWYCFNDASVSEVSPAVGEADIVTPRAYMLFY